MCAARTALVRRHECRSWWRGDGQWHRGLSGVGVISRARITNTEYVMLFACIMLTFRVRPFRSVSSIQPKPPNDGRVPRRGGKGSKAHMIGRAIVMHHDLHALGYQRLRGERKMLGLGSRVSFFRNIFLLVLGRKCWVWVWVVGFHFVCSGQYRRWYALHARAQTRACTRPFCGQL